MEISVKNRKMFSELDEFLSLLPEEERNAIPEEIREFYKTEKDNEYIKNIDASKPISEQNLMIETLSAIAALNLKYWCKDEDEKKRLKKIYCENEMKYQDELRRKYNPDNIFSNEKENKKEEAATAEMIVQENIFKRIFNKIKSILKRN